MTIELIDDQGFKEVLLGSDLKLVGLIGAKPDLFKAKEE